MHLKYFAFELSVIQIGAICTPILTALKDIDNVYLFHHIAVYKLI